jgi:hypothetical protein
MKLRFLFNKKIVWLLLLVLCGMPLHSATVTVPSLELFTKGTPESGSVSLQSEGEIELSISGGFKFGGSMILGFLSDSFEQDLTNRIALGASQGGTLTLKSATISIQKLLGLPLTFSYFLGLGDIFASGDGFSDTFGTAPVSTQYSGFLYFSDGVRYDGIHRVAGTGIKLQLNPVNNRLAAALYLYQDGYFFTGVSPDYLFDPGHYSADFRIMLNLNKIKLEYFLGGTLPASTWGYYRTGFLFHAADRGGEFLAQLGIPRYDPANDTIGLDLFHLLFEARLTLGLFSVIPTVFLHPAYYNQMTTSEGGLIDFNLNLRIGNPEENLINSGVEGNLVFQDQTLQDFEAKVSPYINIVTPGVLWQLKIDANLYPFSSLADMFEGYVGIKAEF